MRRTNVQAMLPAITMTAEVVDRAPSERWARRLRVEERGEFGKSAAAEKYDTWLKELLSGKRQRRRRRGGDGDGAPTTALVSMRRSKTAPPCANSNSPARHAALPALGRAAALAAVSPSQPPPPQPHQPPPPHQLSERTVAQCSFGSHRYRADGAQPLGCCSHWASARRAVVAGC